DFEVALVDLEDRGGGVLRDREHVLAQRLDGGLVDHACCCSRCRYSRAANRAAIERPSEKSSRSASPPIASSGQGTTSSSSGSSPGRRSGERSRASTTVGSWLMYTGASDSSRTTSSLRAP